MRFIATLLAVAACGGRDAGEAGPADAGPADAAPTSRCAVSTDPFCRYVSPRAFTDLRELDEPVLPGAIGGRTLPLLIRYAADATGALPVLYWSHGGTYNNTGDQEGARWGRAFARAGYLVIHVGHVAPNRAQLDAICAEVGVPAAQCIDENIGPGDEDAAPTFSSIGVVRPADAARVLDSLGEIATRLATIGVTIDTGRVAVTGWSGGSQDPIAHAGAVRHLGALPRYAAPDARPRAFFGLSPQGPPYAGFLATDTVSSWDLVRGPMLIATGDGDEKPDSPMTGPIRRQAWEHMPPGDKWMFYSTIDDPEITHDDFALSGLMSGDADREALAAGLQSVAIAFLDAYVRDDADARRWLDSDDARVVMSGRVEWLKK
jgi:hypothetical protein